MEKMLTQKQLVKKLSIESLFKLGKYQTEEYVQEFINKNKKRYCSGAYISSIRENKDLIDKGVFCTKSQGYYILWTL